METISYMMILGWFFGSIFTGIVEHIIYGYSDRGRWFALKFYLFGLMFWGIAINFIYSIIKELFL
jgi:hypothetical protein